ncbi:MAG TPA: adenine deaminase [Streptosporangiaceae bacterium]|nr:adenine deaminase [Streptosporangiaceae bacterium]
MTACDTPAHQGADPVRRRLAVARGDEPADLVLKGGRVLSVFTGEVFEADVAICGEHIAGLGSYHAPRETDVRGHVLVPGLLDAHMHLESTKLMVDQFARAVLPHGTTTVFIDPHEVANVFGLRGVRALLESASAVPLDYYVLVPSCVPASRFEASGATVTAAEIGGFLRERADVIGLAEVMDFPGVVAGDPGVLAKLAAARAAGGHLDGHAPGLSGPALNAYLASGVGSDHECTDLAEALEKRRLGMWIMIREGSAARNLEALLPLVLEHGTLNTSLCTDDREPDQLLREGHMDDVVRKAIRLGCAPADAITMATLNTARWHRRTGLGAVAPGYLADIVAVPDLAEFRPAMVWKRGRLAARDAEAVSIPRAAAPEWMHDSVRIPVLTADDFRVAANGRVRVIGVDPGSLSTRALTAEPGRRGGDAVADPGHDLAKAAVIERHRGTGRIGLGFASGFGLRRGALASTHAHDAHNLVVLGMNDADMALAANRLREIGGGQVAVLNGRVVAELPCPVAGLLSELPFEEVAAGSSRLDEAAHADLGATYPAPFMAMSFLALTVLPELRITDRGLVDVTRFERVPLSVG